ncbi:galactose-binding domain-like protein [Mycena olivaceomarginata]|nr:galactose-binding domain-like protein [Mycena olivaceomarginata]
MEAGGYIIDKAILHGVNQGRGGKGSIFVFASGNAYTSVTVSAVDHKGMRPYYSEGCTANMIAAVQLGQRKTRRATNARLTHGGTSAAAPNAVGVFALAVEARPELTWRDIQHLCDWDTTAAGRKYSSKFGYGVLDGLRFVQAAREWQLVKPQAWLQTRTIQIEGGTMNPMQTYSGGEGYRARRRWDQLQDANFEKLEHITVRVWIDHTRRGDVEVELMSPGGIRSVLAEKRKGDSATTGFPGWRFMTIKHWNIVGDWTLTVSDQASAEHNGTFLGWNMVFWGSVIDSAKAVLYEFFPPHEEPQPLPSASTTKPTVYLSTKEITDPKVAAAEGTVSAEALPTPSKEPSQISIIMDGLTHKLWTYIILVVVASLVGRIFLWRCRVRALAVRLVTKSFLHAIVLARDGLKSP